MLPNGKALAPGMGTEGRKGCIMGGKGMGGWGKGSAIGQGTGNAGIEGGNADVGVPGVTSRWPISCSSYSQVSYCLNFTIENLYVEGQATDIESTLLTESCLSNV